MGLPPPPSRSGGTDRGWLGRARSPAQERARQSVSARQTHRQKDRQTDWHASKGVSLARLPTSLAACPSFHPPPTYPCLSSHSSSWHLSPTLPLPRAGTDRGPSALARPGPNTRARSHDSKSPTWPRPGSSLAFPTEIGGPASPRHADTPLFLARPPAAAGRTVGRVSGRLSLSPTPQDLPWGAQAGWVAPKVKGAQTDQPPSLPPKFAGFHSCTLCVCVRLHGSWVSEYTCVASCVVGKPSLQV